MSDAPVDLQGFFQLPELTPEAIDHYADLVHESYANWEKFAAELSERREQATSGTEALRQGVGYWIISRHADAFEVLGNAADNGARHYYAALAAQGLGRYGDALSELEKAQKKGWDEFEVDMRAAALHVWQSEVDAAQKLVEKHARVGEDRAAWYFAGGLIAEHRDERNRALELYDKALTLQPNHEQAAFRSAWLYDMRGDDEQAIELYERLAERPRARVNALMNLAVIYEDLGRNSDALVCLRRVLKVNPNHARARLFLKDVESSRQMVIDDNRGPVDDARSRLLEAPISEFELSVRARNCLKKMNINTLGQLVQLSEVELLAYKNFGEASLNEIKQLLARKGLRLGQRFEDIQAPAETEQAEEAPAAPRIQAPPGREAVLAKPVSELELSVRSRRCLQRLNVITIGDLIQHKESDLLAARNFGVTSLNEIKGKLAENGLQLAPDAEE